MCMVDMFGYVSAPCDWIETGVYRDNMREAWLKGTKKGKICCHSSLNIK